MWNCISLKRNIKSTSAILQILDLTINHKQKWQPTCVLSKLMFYVFYLENDWWLFCVMYVLLSGGVESGCLYRTLWLFCLMYVLLSGGVESGWQYRTLWLFCLMYVLLLGGVGSGCLYRTLLCPPNLVASTPPKQSGGFLSNLHRWSSRMCRWSYRKDFFLRRFLPELWPIVITNVVAALGASVSEDTF
jgi:hypothetical protein